MSLNLSSRHEWVRRSALRSMSVECEKVGGVNLSQGVCDLEVPEPCGSGSYTVHAVSGIRPAKQASRAVMTVCAEGIMLM